MIAVNSAIRNVPWADCFFSEDWRWFESPASCFLTSFEGEKYAAIPERFHSRFSHLGLIYLQRGRDPGLSEDPSTLNLRADSGYGALGIAYLKGARRITLYGFDLRPGRCYDGGPPEDVHLYAQWAAEYRGTLPQLAKKNIVVLNANRSSTIDAYRTGDH